MERNKNSKELGKIVVLIEKMQLLKWKKKVMEQLVRWDRYVPNMMKMEIWNI